MTGQRIQLLLEWARRGGELEEWLALSGAPLAMQDRFRWAELRAAAALWMAERGWVGEDACTETTSRDGQALVVVHSHEQSALLRESCLHVLAGALGSSTWAHALTGEAPTAWVAWRARGRRELALRRAVGRGLPPALLIPTLWSPELLHPECAAIFATAAQHAYREPGTGRALAGLALAWAHWLLGDPRCLAVLEDARAALPSGAECWRGRFERCRIAALAQVGRFPAALASLETWLEQGRGHEPMWPAWGLLLAARCAQPARAQRFEQAWAAAAASADPRLVAWLGQHQDRTSSLDSPLSA